MYPETLIHNRTINKNPSQLVGRNLRLPTASAALRASQDSALLKPLRRACKLEQFFFSSRRRHTRFDCDWSSDVCSSDLSCGIPPRPPRIPWWASPAAVPLPPAAGAEKGPRLRWDPTVSITTGPPFSVRLLPSRLAGRADRKSVV